MSKILGVRKLVPTRVGMILRVAIEIMMSGTCPHTRGDDPFEFAYIVNEFNLSQHAWG